MSEDQSQLVARFDALRTRFDTLHSKASLSDEAQAVTQLTADIGKLPGEISEVRKRGYHFASYLEHKAEVLAERWNAVREEVSQVIETEAEQLRNEVNRLRRRVDSANGLKDSPALASQLPDLQRGVEVAETLLKTAQERIDALFDTLQTDTAQTLQQLHTINWYLDERDEASFSFLQGESLFLAAKAEWLEGKDKPDGILYLTDQRLLFEQKETTGKKLGLFGGKKTQELEFELPLHQIESVQPENKGFLGGKDMLNFTLGAGAPYGAVTVEVKGGVQSKFWAAQIQRMIEGKTDDERAIQPDPETLEAIRNAPTACPSCGGTLPQLVANQRQIDCAYCGAVIRI
jgi:3-oxoacyl-ACP reductase-like protein